MRLRTTAPPQRRLTVRPSRIGSVSPRLSRCATRSGRTRFCPSPYTRSNAPPVRRQGSGRRRREGDAGGGGADEGSPGSKIIARPKPSVSSGLFCGGARGRRGHWVFPCASGNRVFYGAYCDWVGMCVSSFHALLHKQRERYIVASRPGVKELFRSSSNRSPARRKEKPESMGARRWRSRVRLAVFRKSAFYGPSF